MLRVIACITQEHDLRFVAAAAIVCVIGSCLTVMMCRRLVTATLNRKRVQLVLSSMIAGTTIWSTHFIAMLAYDPGVNHGYEPSLTGLSLVLAVLGNLIANSVFAYSNSRYRFLVAGMLFGMTVSIMHYTGMQAYQVPGDLIWDRGYVGASLVLGMILGAIAYHRIMYPVTKVCWLFGAIFMVLAICAMHFTAMTAVSIQLSPLVAVPQSVLSDSTIGIAIFAIALVLLLIGFAAISIEMNLERESLGQIEHTASHDRLTDLPNRLRMLAVLHKLPRGQIHGAAYAIIKLDIVGFKQVNDLHGHAMGDQILQTVASRIKDSVGSADFVARSGGDEFVVIRSDPGTTEDVIAFAEKLLRNTGHRIETEAFTGRIDMALGLAYAEPGATATDLLHRADLAIYQAKTDPEQRICVYDAQMDQDYKERLRLTEDLRLAIDQDQLELVFQLQNDLKTMQPIGCEVLLRWRHPDLGMVSPGLFIPIAEETGLIREIGQWVLRAACIEAAKWEVPLTIAVNVAPQQLVQASFFENLSDILFESRLAPQRLELEITEASLIRDHAGSFQMMHRIKMLGVKIAMDDFGTGYSSLATLRDFPFDKIKIDQSFVRNVHQDAQRAAIVRASLLLGRSLDIPALAEGVETEDELRFLQSEGCLSAQGFYFGKPKTVPEIIEIIDTLKPLKAS